jgi:putative transposase
MRENNLLCLRKKRRLLKTDSQHLLPIYPNSDRGSQYASWLYTKMLKDNGIKISMSRKANPYDNARMERFFKTLKEEENYLFEYASILEAKQRIVIFIDDLYNKKRLHSSISYLPPNVFEQTFFHLITA